MKVLVVDDDAVCRLALEAMILELGFACVTAADGRHAWELMRHEAFDVLITDREMPYLSGVELCHLVRSELTTHVYVILATQFGSLDQAREGMLAGADDYLIKPTRLEDLQLRLIAAERVNQVHRALEGTNKELRAVARRDSLTGLGNRRSLSEDLVVMAARAKRYGHSFSIALLDIDYFKAFNDLYGHQRGDEALKSVAKVIMDTIRSGDSCYRYGGEEFLCIYPEQSVTGARIVVERIRENVAALAIAHAGGVADCPVTLSAGIAQLSPENLDAQGVMRAADSALYAAKRLGRNRVEIEAPLVSGAARLTS